MSKLSLISFFLFCTIILENLSSVESDRNYTKLTQFVKHRIQKRIVGGWSTEKYQNTVFSLLFKSGHCTGTFIASNAILTAAHCCENSKSKNLAIDNHIEALIVTVLNYHIHPDHKSEVSVSNTDIAIIELADKIDSVIPANLDYNEVECRDTVWMYGYGWIDENGRKETELLQKLPSKVDRCNDWIDYLTDWFSYGNVIATYGWDGTTCSGDSGGPMFNQQGDIVGIHSGSIKENGDEVKCPKNQLVIHVRISSHKYFIQSVLNKQQITLNSTTTSAVGYDLLRINFLTLITLFIIYYQFS